MSTSCVLSVNKSISCASIRPGKSLFLFFQIDDASADFVRMCLQESHRKGVPMPFPTGASRIEEEDAVDPLIKRMVGMAVDHNDRPDLEQPLPELLTGLHGIADAVGDQDRFLFHTTHAVGGKIVREGRSIHIPPDRHDRGNLLETPQDLVRTDIASVDNRIHIAEKSNDALMKDAMRV